MGQDNDNVRNSVNNAACDSFIYWWTDMDGEQFKLYCPLPQHIAWMDGSIPISAPSICIKLSIYQHVRAELIVKSLPKSKKVNRPFTCCTHMCVNLHTKAVPNQHLKTPTQHQMSTWNRKSSFSRNIEGSGGGYMLDKNALNMNNLKQTLLYDTKYMAEKGSKSRFLV